MEPKARPALALGTGLPPQGAARETEDDSGPPAGRSVLGPKDYLAVVATLKRWAGITLDPVKSRLIDQRLRRCLERPDRAAVHHLLAETARCAVTRQRFINALTTNETYFFRTPRVWAFLRSSFLPSWRQAAHAGRRLQIWSAASATGEEPYSLAILCSQFARGAPGFQFQVTASDIDTDVLASARRGEYAGRSAETLQRAVPMPGDLYLPGTAPGSILIHPAVRSRVEFLQHNLFEPWRGPAAWADLILLRNVLIYFDAPEQRQVLARMGAALRPGGVLVLGESESLLSLGSEFVYLGPQIYRLGGGS